MNELIKLFEYEGNKVTFKTNDGTTYVNATQMAKPFGKRSAEYLRLPSTVTLINAIVGFSHYDINQLVITERGGINPCTWLHEDIALDLAQWLSIDFKLWCNDRLKELLTTGKTEILIPENDDEIILKSMTILQSRLSVANMTIEEQDRTIKIQEPVVNYAIEVLSSTSTYNTEQIAKELGMRSPQQLNNLLKSMKVQHKSGNQWVLNANYCTKGYTETETYPYNDNGVIKTSTRTVWNELGRRFIHDLLNENLKKHG